MRCCSISLVTDDAFRPFGVMDPFGHRLGFSNACDISGRDRGWD